jgi:chemotaxis protein histidine kinase CheA
MTRAGWIASASFGVLLALAAPGWAASGSKEKEAVQKIEALNTSGMTSYQAGEHERAKAQLMEALVVGKKADLDTNPVLARTYLDLGIVSLEGLKDKEKAARYFTLALRIKPTIEIPPVLATEGVKRELEQARSGLAAEATAKETAAKETAAKETAPARPAAAAADTAKDESAAKERNALRKDLAQAQDGEKKERETREKLQKDKQDADSKLAAAREGEKKEREAREKLEKEKAESEKQIAALKESEKKERDLREKLEKQLAELKDGQQKEKQLADAREKERKTHDEQERVVREKLMQGPEFPSQIPSPVFCPTPDEGQRGADIFVHCALQPSNKATAVALYYRPSGVVHFNSLAMERGKKGWYTAVIPATNIPGKLVQYYVEARNGKGEVTASYGKPGSPNIMTLKPATTTPMAKEDRPSATLVPARSVEGKPSPRKSRPKAH